jgi:hypothetical protein
MPDHSIIEPTANGNALQLYLGVRFCEDSGTPDLEAGEPCLVQSTGTGGILIQPLRALTYPVTVDGPPDGLDEPDLPAEVASVIAEIDAPGDPPAVATNGDRKHELTTSSAGEEPAPTNTDD